MSCDVMIWIVGMSIVAAVSGCIWLALVGFRRSCDRTIAHMRAENALLAKSLSRKRCDK